MTIDGTQETKHYANQGHQCFYRFGTVEKEESSREEKITKAWTAGFEEANHSGKQ